MFIHVLGYVLGLLIGVVALVLGILFQVGVFNANFEEADTNQIMSAVFLVGALVLIFRQPPSGD